MQQNVHGSECTAANITLRGESLQCALGGSAWDCCDCWTCPGQRIPAKLNERAPNYFARNDLETLMSSPDSSDWIKISEMLLGRTPEGFKFVPKHKANAYSDEAQRDTEKRQKR